MSHVESPVAPVLPRIGARGDAGLGNLRPVSFKPRQQPEGSRFSLRGTLLYPAILTAVSFAAWLVTRDKNGLR